MSDLPALTPDCSQCAALCCMALAFDAGEDFAIDKPAGLPCPNLTADHACGIYQRLEEEGFPGCARYSCLGAGQRVTQEIFAGQSWQQEPALAEPMAEAFRQMREVQGGLELLLAAEAIGLDEEDEETRQRLIAALAPEEGLTAESLGATKATLAEMRRFLASLSAYL